ncbi:GbsR/MarR family transcriptional regulator [Paenibacillus endoradicis]|uniref:GbsR/MarR family transcriptional regulator n=1 Tax=Paenibacillus endoradicis TaxID=2972487 RepID=UPI0021594382|nr:transcriptional regulator [Paenibacillus endoradicis]MCR8657173.1 transcriptional regulator [Paenibacillus endoradicis]
MRKATLDKLTKQHSKREQLRANVIDAIAQTMDLYGVNYTFGQLYGVMFFEDRPMTLEEMQDNMGMSKSNMSYAIRSLLESQMVTKLKEKEERKDLYVAETDFFHVFQTFFADKLQREIDVMKEAIEPVIPSFTEIIVDLNTTEEERSLTLDDLHKMKQTIHYYDWLQQFVDKLRDGEFFPEGQGIERKGDEMPHIE